MTVNEYLLKGASALYGYETPLSEATILLGHAIGKDKLWLMTHSDDVIEPKNYDDFIDRRVQGEPVEYITQKVAFYSEEFIISKGALIPRPETEILVNKVLETLNKDFDGHIVEVGTGSGIISIILALNLPKAKITAIDIAKEALVIAAQNIEKFSLEDNITLVQGNMLEDMDENIDVLVSNPPYIKEKELLEKPLAYEPQNALFGGIEGDEMLKSLLIEVKERGIPYAFCEMGYDQKEPLETFTQGFKGYSIRFYKDLARLDRGFSIQKDKNA